MFCLSPRSGFQKTSFVRASTSTAAELKFNRNPAIHPPYDIVKQCPCEPLDPVGDMQAVSYGVCSRHYNPLLSASLLFWSRLVHADLAMHATLAALGNGFNVIYCAFPFQQPLREWMTTKIHGARTYGPHLPKARAIAGYSATHASNNEGARVRQCIETTVEIILVTAVV